MVAVLARNSGYPWSAKSHSQLSNLLESLAVSSESQPRPPGRLRAIALTLVLMVQTGIPGFHYGRFLAPNMVLSQGLLLGDRGTVLPILAGYFLPSARRFRGELSSEGQRPQRVPSMTCCSLRGANAFRCSGSGPRGICRSRVFNDLPHLRLRQSNLFPFSAEDVRNTFPFFAEWCTLQSCCPCSWITVSC
jgi:hypothetical protein